MTVTQVRHSVPQQRSRRPKYENVASLLLEEEAARKFSAKTGCVLTKNPSLEPGEKGVAVDYTAHAPSGRTYLVEVRTRNIASTKHATWHIGLRKVQNVKRYAERRGLPAVILISWTDRQGLIDVDRLLAKGTITISGRRDRGDRFDWEEMLNVPLSEIRFL